MILIGQFDSSFVRRVAIAMELYGIAYDHRPWSCFGDADKIRDFNPLTRVPTLVLDDGKLIINSASMIDYLDEQVDEARVLMAPKGPQRQAALYLIDLATGFVDKGVSLYYELNLNHGRSDIWRERCHLQMSNALDRLEAECAVIQSPWLLGSSMGHADIAIACGLTHMRGALMDQFEWTRWPNLMKHRDKCENTDVFKKINQEFIPPS